MSSKKAKRQDKQITKQQLDRQTELINISTDKHKKLH